MFDFGFSEMLVIGVIALVVLGPERLPVVARTAGEWVGKAQRFVAQVKSDIDRETELSELKRIQDEAKALADDASRRSRSRPPRLKATSSLPPAKPRPSPKRPRTTSRKLRRLRPARLP